jgi:hypothetical protein
MTFIPDARLEAGAIELWRAYQLQVRFDIEILLDDLDLSLLWEPISDANGEKILGALRPAAAQVVLNEARLGELEGNEGLRRFTIAHEIGHWTFHTEGAGSVMLPFMTDGRVLCRDGSRHPMETQADRFASYLLAPTDLLRLHVPEGKWQGWPEIYRLAEFFGMSPTAMIVRLQRQGWAHRQDEGVPESGPAQAPGQCQFDFNP